MNRELKNFVERIIMLQSAMDGKVIKEIKVTPEFFNQLKTQSISNEYRSFADYEALDKMKEVKVAGVLIKPQEIE